MNQRTISNNNLYITATARGTEYTLMRQGGGWFVASQRLALGRSHIGGGKHYETLAQVAQGCKAFGTEAELIAAVYGLTQEATA
jgi:hypothetical protein